MSAVAAAIVVKEKHIVQSFRDARATGPDTSIVPASIGVTERAASCRLRRRAVLREASAGTFYLDEPSWQTLRALRRSVLLVVPVGLLGVLLALSAFSSCVR